MPTLTDRAMLVTLSVKQWTASKHDKTVSREVATAHSSDVNMGRYNKQLLAKTALEKIKRAAGAARNEHYYRTLPWSDEGFRMLSSAGYFEYAEKMRALQGDFDTAVSEFLQNYPQYVDDARAKLNGLFNPTDYPSEKEMRGKFSLGFNVCPVPTASDFRVDLGDAETAKVKAEIQAATDATVKAAMSDAFDRVRKVIAHMAESLQNYAVGPDGTKNPFRDSLVSNVCDMAQILPTLNVTGDPALDQIARDITANLCRHSAEDLRTSDWKRAETASRAQEILAKMSSYV